MEADMAKDTTKAKAPVADTKPEHRDISPAKLQPKVATAEEAEHHFKAVRDLVQQLRNRGDQDNNKVLDNIAGHLDAIDGNPEKVEAERLEQEQNQKAAEKRAEKVEAA
jgi:hypothetical protein